MSDDSKNLQELLNGLKKDRRILYKLEYNDLDEDRKKQFDHIIIIENKDEKDDFTEYIQKRLNKSLSQLIKFDEHISQIYFGDFIIEHNYEDNTKHVTNLTKNIKPTYINYSILKKFTTRTNKNKYGIVATLDAHGGNSIGTFIIPPNIRIVTLFRDGKSTYSNPYRDGFLKYLINEYYIKGNIDDFKTIGTVLRHNFGLYKDWTEFLRIKHMKNFDPVEHDPGQLMTNQTLDFSGYQDYTLPQGLVVLNHDNHNKIIDKYSYGKCIYNKETTLEECKDFKEHLAFGFGFEKSDDDAYLLSDIVYYTSNLLRQHNPGQIMTIFIGHCRPHMDIKPPPKLKLFRAVSENTEEKINTDKSYIITSNDDEYNRKVNLDANNYYFNSFIKKIKKSIRIKKNKKIYEDNKEDINKIINLFKPEYLRDNKYINYQIYRIGIEIMHAKILYFFDNEKTLHHNHLSDIYKNFITSTDTINDGPNNITELKTHIKDLLSFNDNPIINQLGDLRNDILTIKKPSESNGGGGSSEDAVIDDIDPSAAFDNTGHGAAHFRPALDDSVDGGDDGGADGGASESKGDDRDNPALSAAANTGDSKEESEGGGGSSDNLKYYKKYIKYKNKYLNLRSNV
jgi:hypothetical protein